MEHPQVIARNNFTIRHAFDEPAKRKNLTDDEKLQNQRRRMIEDFHLAKSLGLCITELRDL